MKRRSTQLVLPIMLLTAAPLTAQDVAAGRALYATCAACHGAAGEGNKALNAPALAGQETWYVTRQLQNFKSGARGGGSDAYGAQMAPMAMMLADDAAIANVAAFLASLTPGEITHDGVGDAAAGRGLYAPCAACHGPNGQGLQAMNAPNLTLQQDWYLVRQLQNFKSGARGGGSDAFGAQMAPMAMTLPNDAAIQNVVAYIASLR